MFVLRQILQTRNHSLAFMIGVLNKKKVLVEDLIVSVSAIVKNIQFNVWQIYLKLWGLFLKSKINNVGRG